MSLAAIEPASPLAASELAGPLERVNIYHGEFFLMSLAELESEADDTLERLREDHWRLAELFLAVVRLCPSVRPSDRARALDEFCVRIGFCPRYARQHIQAVRCFPAQERQDYPQLSWGQLHQIATGTALSGEPASSPERIERARRMAREIADRNLGVNGTKRLVREAMEAERARLGPPPAILDAPLPGDSAAPVLVQSEDWRADRDAALLPFLLDGLEKRLRADEPGTWPLTCACVETHLRERLRAWREAR
jgi:hypothetical protein